MQVIFLGGDGITVAMPVMPPGYQIMLGHAVETIDMAQTGQLNIHGAGILFRQNMEFLLPGGPRSYTAPGYTGRPYDVVGQLVRWSEQGEVLRFIVTGTSINIPILLGPVQYGERGGAGDVSVVLELCQYRETGGKRTRPLAETERAGRRKYTVRSGDSLWHICRCTYGDGGLAGKLAQANDILNPNLIFPGQELVLPPRDEL